MQFMNAPNMVIIIRAVGGLNDDAWYSGYFSWASNTMMKGYFPSDGFGYECKNHSSVHQYSGLCTAAQQGTRRLIHRNCARKAHGTSKSH